MTMYRCKLRRDVIVPKGSDIFLQITDYGKTIPAYNANGLLFPAHTQRLIAKPEMISYSIINDQDVKKSKNRLRYLKSQAKKRISQMGIDVKSLKVIY